MKKGKRGVTKLELLTAILCLVSQLIGLLTTIIDKLIDWYWLDELVRCRSLHLQASSPPLKFTFIIDYTIKKKKRQVMDLSGV